MITNERQYKIARAQAERFRSALSESNELVLIRDGVDPIIAAAHKDALREQLRELDEGLARYEALRDGLIQELVTDQFQEIGVQLIEARIARELSQKELAVRLGLKEQQIQRYEQELYLTANVERLSQIANALALRASISFHLNVPGVSNEQVRSFDPSKLPIREMKKRGWLRDYSNEKPDRLLSDAAQAAAFVHGYQGDGNAFALHRKNVRSGSTLNEYALAAWQARILQKADRVRGLVDCRDPIDAKFVKELVELSQSPDGPVKAVSALRQRGVIVVFERHLQGTHLDGAAMLLGSVPVIGMTLRHDRLDNFWFTLMHEVGHVVRHREQGLKEGFFDDSTVSSSEALEAEADEFAENALIPTEAWKSSFVRFTNSPEQVSQFARRFKIGESVVAGRIRRERGYHLFKDLIGSGRVRELISGAGLSE